MNFFINGTSRLIYSIMIINHNAFKNYETLMGTIENIILYITIPMIIYVIGNFLFNYSHIKKTKKIILFILFFSSCIYIFYRLYGSIISKGSNWSTSIVNQETGLEYNFFSWEQNLILISWDFRLIWWITDRLDKQYPHVRIWTWELRNAVLRIIVDFTPEYIKKNPWLVYSYKVSTVNWKIEKTPSTNFVFALKYWFWKVSDWNPANWWRYNVKNYALYPSNNYANDLDNGFNGAFLGKDIVWWKEYIIQLDNVPVGNANRNTQSEPMFEYTNSVNFLNKHKWESLPVSARLSNAWMRGTIIKYMEIIYDGDPWVIQKTL